MNSILQIPLSPHRYCMGVGYALDIMVCVAHGVDMFDCVYPCRTARFGTALTRQGQLRLVSPQKFRNDNGPIEKGCDCHTCQNYSRHYLSTICAKNDLANPIASTLLTIHNIRFMMRLMGDMRGAIKAGKFSEWVIEFLKEMYPGTVGGPGGECQAANDDSNSSATNEGPAKKSEKQVVLPPEWVKNALVAAKIRGIEKAFDWENGVYSTEDMPKAN